MPLQPNEEEKPKSPKKLREKNCEKREKDGNRGPLLIRENEKKKKKKDKRKKNKK